MISILEWITLGFIFGLFLGRITVLLDKAEHDFTRK